MKNLYGNSYYLKTVETFQNAMHYVLQKKKPSSITFIVAISIEFTLKYGIIF